MNKKFNKIQILRFFVQLVLMAGLIFSLCFIPSTRNVSSRLLPTILLVGVFFCNYFCTGGARMGLFSELRIFGIRRNTEQCKQCGHCTRTCPMNIDVAHTDFERHPNRIGCLRCVSSCPRKLLKYGLMPGKKEKNRK